MLSALLVGAAALLWAPAAAAHDDLVGSDPPPGSTVAEPPAQVTLTFSGAVLAEPGTAVVVVADAAGSPLQQGEPVVSGPVVTQPLAGAVSGPVTVQWRVVSADGHPISGEFGFVVTAPAPSPTPTTAPATSATAPTADASTAGPGETDQGAATADRDAGGVPLYGWLIGGAAVLLAIAVVVWLLAARSRQQHQTVRDRTAGRTDTGDR